MAHDGATARQEPQVQGHFGAELRRFGVEWDDSRFWRGVWDFVRYGFMPHPKDDENRKDQR